MQAECHLITLRRSLSDRTVLSWASSGSAGYTPLRWTDSGSHTYEMRDDQLHLSLALTGPKGQRTAVQSL